MYETNEFKKGLRVEIDGIPYVMVDVEFVKPGKGQAFTRVKIKNMLSANTINRTFKSGEKLPPADIIDKEMQFLYLAENTYHFMDNATYEQYEMNKESVGESWKWLTEGLQATVTLYNGQPIAANLPNFSVLEITHCDPANKGDTVTNATKNATLQTGAIVQVPLFVEQNDKIRIDTRTGLYVDRVK